MTKKTNYHEARDYSTSIAREILALETLATLDRETNPQLFAEQLTIVGLQGINDDTNPLGAYLNATALEVTFYHATGNHDHEPKTRTVILRTCGGPRCEITRDSNDGHIIEVTTYVDNDKHSHRITAPNVAAELDEIAIYQ